MNKKIKTKKYKKSKIAVGTISLATAITMSVAGFLFTFKNNKNDVINFEEPKIKIERQIIAEANEEMSNEEVITVETNEEITSEEQLNEESVTEDGKEEESKEDKKLTPGQIAGVVAGSMAGTALLVGSLFLFVNKGGRPMEHSDFYMP